METSSWRDLGLRSRRLIGAALCAGLTVAGLVVVSTGSAAVAVAEASPAPAASSQLVTVNTASSSATSGTLSAWDRGNDGSWTRVFGPVTAWVGSRGVGSTSEGQSRTPVGTFPLTESFGRQPNPGTAMPYFTSDVNDWWNSNTASPQYNTHVRQAGNPGGASENLYRTGAVYDYAVNIGYNLERTPGAGSAFFLHVTDGTPTAGCVSIDRATLIGVLQWLNPARNPAIDIRVGAAWTPSAAPVGSLDIGQSAGLTTGSPQYQVAGWAFDPDNPAAALAVHLYDFRPDGAQAATALTADADRSDIGAAFPGAGSRHGFAGSIGLTGPGRHTVCAYAIDTGPSPAGNTTLGCRSVDVPGPTGRLDSVVNNAPGQLAAAGWAADPLAPGQAEPVHVYVSGPTGSVGYPTGTGIGRGDVVAVVPWAGANSGFSATAAAPVAGNYTACAYAINVNAPRTNPLLNCRAVTVADVFGVFDAVAASSGSLQVSGWALNPNAGGNRVAVHVYDYGSTLRTFVLAADAGRGDVAAAFPGFDNRHGFAATMPAGAPGVHNVCVYAINAGGGSATNPLLGCRTVVV